MFVLTYRAMREPKAVGRTIAVPTLFVLSQKITVIEIITVMGAETVCMRMKEIERASLMRIASDIIHVDAIIDLRELSFLENIRQKISYHSRR